MATLKTYPDGTPFTGVIGRTTEESSPAWPEPPRARDGAPNVILFVLDDVGYGQLSSFGGLSRRRTSTARGQRAALHEHAHHGALLAIARRAS